MAGGGRLLLRASAVMLATGAGLGAAAPADPPVNGEAEAKAMTTHARGEFDVALSPLAGELGGADEELGRMRIDKSYRGELEGTAVGEMLTALTAVEGSAGYVAIERVSAALAGRTGTFVLQHSGTMDRGAQSLAIRVVPDSGTGGLAGISGTMTLRIEGGKHFYDFEYSLREEP